MGSLILMLVLIVFSISVYQTSKKPFHKAEKEAFAIGQKSAGLATLDDFYWYNGEETYFTVVGQNEDDTPVVAIISQNGGETTVFNQVDVVSKEEAMHLTRQAVNPEKILEARIGMEDGTAIWEISYKQKNGQLGYYFLSLETGEWIKGIENI